MNILIGIGDRGVQTPMCEDLPHVATEIKCTVTVSWRLTDTSYTAKLFPPVDCVDFPHNSRQFRAA